MADVIVNSVEVVDGVLHIYGSNFTQTTTSVYVDEALAEHVFVSATELTIDPAPAPNAQVVVDKGGIAAMAIGVPGETSGEGGGADVLAGGAEGNTGLAAMPEDLMTEQEKAARDNPQEGDVSKLPYPEGNPPSEEDERRRAMGLPREEEAAS